MPTPTMTSEKQIYQAKVQAELDKFNAQVDEWNAKARKMQAEAQLEYNNSLESILTQQKAFQKKLEELQVTSEDAWEDLKTGVDLAWRDLQASCEVAMSRFSNM